jgi:hypothetical protein
VNSIDPAAPVATPAEAEARREIDALLYERRNPDGSFSGNSGSGAFRLAEWEPGKHAVLAANPEFSGGRAFLDSVEIQVGRPDAERLLDLESGKTDLALIPPQDTRQARDRGIRLSISQPDELLAIVMLENTPAQRQQQAVRGEALSRAIDRGAMVNFILQKQGEPAGGLLPQWSSGSAFLFSTDVDVSAARAIWGQIGGSPGIALGYDAGDPLELAIAERIVVNAREAGVPLRAQSLGAVSGGASAPAVDARLIRLRMNSPRPRETLAGMESALAPLTGVEASPLLAAATPEQIYERERSIVGGYRVVPLVWLPQIYGLGPRVWNWSAPMAGEPWPLADVWMGEGQ